tara:strand:- start:6352 stop:6549 length:198 start_codon:yes stop_codon:yes gene_type:complete
MVEITEEQRIQLIQGIETLADISGKYSETVTLAFDAIDIIKRMGRIDLALILLDRLNKIIGVAQE